MGIDYRRIEVVDDDMVPILRAKTGAQRLQMASDMLASVRQMLTSQIRASRPEWDEQTISREVAWRISHGACGPRPTPGR